MPPSRRLVAARNFVLRHATHLSEEDGALEQHLVLGRIHHGPHANRQQHQRDRLRLEREGVARLRSDFLERIERAEQLRPRTDPKRRARRVP